MQFSYMAYTLKEGLLKGRVEAKDAGEAQFEVAKSGYKPLRVRPALQPPEAETIFSFLLRTNDGEVVRFARQMATMLGSGAGLIRTLEILQAETRNRLTRRTLEAIRKALEGGDSFSAALAQHPRVFSPLFITMIEVGEWTGRLGPALEQVANVLEKEQEARRKAAQT